MMTLDEYLQQPFKTDGEGNAVIIADEWPRVPRTIRRQVERELKKGKVPDFVNDVLDRFACSESNGDSLSDMRR